MGEIQASGEDEETRSEPKLLEAKSIRELSKFIDDENAIAYFRSSGGTLQNALSHYQAKHPEDWRGAIANAESILGSLTPDALRTMEEDDISLIQSLSERINQVLSDHNLLAKGE